MVFRVKHSKLPLLFGVLLLTVLFGFPYLSRDFLGLEHDTLFHLSRIEGLAESISRCDFFPALYPYKNNGFGYASPLFYNDLFLIPSALLYLCQVPLSICYILQVIVLTFCSAWAMASLCYRITDCMPAALVSAAAFTFSNYRITDVYVRGALGEVTAMLFLILLVEAVYVLFEEQNKNGWFLLWLSISGLLCSHNLTALMGIIVFLLYWICLAPRCSRSIHRSCLKALVLSFLSTAWFTIPMLEQLHSQQFLLNYYASASDLADSALSLSRYLANKTVFGYASNQLPEHLQMTLNPGYFLMLSPLLWFALPKNSRSSAVLKLTLLVGVVSCLLPSQLLPWDRLQFLRVLQFPWRFLNLAIVFLAIPASYAIAKLFSKRNWVMVGLLVILLGEGFWHVLPARGRDFGITSSTAYEDLLSGELIDPYYSASYVRVELAGGEYLPINSPDFRTYTPSIKDTDEKDLFIPYVKDGLRFDFTVDNVPEGTAVVLPLTWYKGYRAYDSDGAIAIHASKESLVEVVCDHTGTYTVVYEATLLRRICGWISLFALSAVLFCRHFLPVREE